MRVLIVNSLYPPIQVGGAEKSVGLLAEALVRSGVDVAVASLHPGTSEEQEIRNGVRVYRLPLDNIFWPFGIENRPGLKDRMIWNIKDLWNSKAAKRFDGILEMERPDVVHTNNLRGFSVAVWKQARRRNIRVVHTLRDYALVCRRGMFRDGRVCESQCSGCKVVSELRRQASKNVDMVVSNSEYTLRAHQKSGFFDGTPSAVTFNIAGGPKPSERSQERKNSDSLVFGFVGALNEHKGIETVLEATTKLQHNSWILKVAGKGTTEYVGELQRRFNDPRIEWLGFVAADRYYPEIDVAVIASIWPEPLPRTMIEALNYDRSILCARAGGIPELISMGKVVRSYDPYSVSELAKLMDEALANPALWKTGGFVDDAARVRFSEADVVARYISSYTGRG